MVRRDEEVWARSEQGWIKINFDGASRGNPGISSTRCVAGDEEGKIIFKGAHKLQDGTSNEAEVQVTLLAVELANNMNIPRVHLEGDSKVVVDAIVKGASPSWRLNKFISIICSKIIIKILDFQITHIRRGGGMRWWMRYPMCIG